MGKGKRQWLSEGRKTSYRHFYMSVTINSAEDIQEKHPSAMKSWGTNRDAICPIFKFSTDAHKVIYTTNAIESLNSAYCA